MDLPGIDYARMIAAAAKTDLAGLHGFLAEELPYVWLESYVAMLPHEQNVPPDQH